MTCLNDIRTPDAKRRALQEKIQWAVSIVALAWMTSATAGRLSMGTFAPFVFDASLAPPRDAAVGSLLAWRSSNYGLHTENVSCPVDKLVRVNGPLVPGTNNIYQTNVPGIGVRFYTTGRWAGSWESAPASYSFTVPVNGGAQWYARADFVVTGPIGSGQLTILPNMTVTYSGSCFPTITDTQTIEPITRILATSCSVLTPSMTVALPEAKESDFAHAGEAHGNTPFRIGLSCQPGAEVYITLTDETDSGNRSNLLTLTQDSTAQGVKLQLLYNGAPVSYGPDSAVAGTPNQWRVGPSSSVTGVPLTAQYVATGPVRPGSVKANATFTMSYQ